MSIHIFAIIVCNLAAVVACYVAVVGEGRGRLR